MRMTSVKLHRCMSTVGGLQQCSSPSGASPVNTSWQHCQAHNPLSEAGSFNRCGPVDRPVRVQLIPFVLLRARCFDLIVLIPLELSKLGLCGIGLGMSPGESPRTCFGLDSQWGMWRGKDKSRAKAEST